jgi:hypothetical protein
VEIETAAYFQNIEERLLELLGRAQFEITVAVAWFTEPKLFNQLCQMAGKRIAVRLLLIDDEINMGPSGLNFQRLRDIGGAVHLIPDAKRGGSRMHNKFAVIDRATVITGSYNWSRQARTNHENITVIHGDRELAARYLLAWQSMFSRYGGDTGEAVRIDPAVVSRRLQIIKNFALLGDVDEMREQIERLTPFASDASVAEIVQLFQEGDVDSAISRIDRFQVDRLALVSLKDIELGDLRLELTTLEIELTAITTEKDEIERRILEYERRSNLEIGDLMTEYLRLRQEKLARTRAESAESQKEYEEADEEYREYRDAHESLKNEPDIPELDATQAAEIKRLFRRASQLCHPDKVAEADKADAHIQFVALQHAYRNNDISTVQRILDPLRSGRMYTDLTETLTDTERLRRQIVAMRIKIENLLVQIDQLVACDAYSVLKKEVTDWTAYFEEEREKLRTAIAAIRDELGENQV